MEQPQDISYIEVLWNSFTAYSKAGVQQVYFTIKEIKGGNRVARLNIKC